MQILQIACLINTNNFISTKRFRENYKIIFCHMRFITGTKRFVNWTNLFLQSRWCMLIEGGGGGMAPIGLSLISAASLSNPSHAPADPSIWFLHKTLYLPKSPITPRMSVIIARLSWCCPPWQYTHCPFPHPYMVTWRSCTLLASVMELGVLPHLWRRCRSWNESSTQLKL